MTDVTTSTLEAPVGLSYWELFLHASFVVQLVIVGLLILSILCWAIIIDRSWYYKRIQRKDKTFTQKFWSGLSMDELYDHAKTSHNTPTAAIFITAVEEWRNSMNMTPPAIKALPERLDRAMDTAIALQRERLERFLSLLATTGSAAPFIGLFGTVWGIMASFQSIAASKSTNIAVVAPHIAEALLATAIGLFAAIPAVMAYNRLTKELNGLTNNLERFADEFAVILSRQIDERL